MITHAEQLACRPQEALKEYVNEIQYPFEACGFRLRGNLRRLARSLTLVNQVSATGRIRINVISAVP